MKSARCAHPQVFTVDLNSRASAAPLRAHAQLYSPMTALPRACALNFCEALLVAVPARMTVVVPNADGAAETAGRAELT